MFNHPMVTGQLVEQRTAELRADAARQRTARRFSPVRRRVDDRRR
jgi:hypothetical protein